MVDMLIETFNFRAARVIFIVDVTSKQFYATEASFNLSEVHLI